LRLQFHKPSAHKLGAHAYVGGHLGYFISVAFEGHGYYALFGGFMFVMVLLNCFFHFAEEA
jgi:hypothetical protein